MTSGWERGWERWPFCNVCGMRGFPYGTSADLANFLKRLCKGCGTCGDFEIRIVRWVSDSVWWKPWTWDRGHWKKKESDSLSVPREVDRHE